MNRARRGIGKYAELIGLPLFRILLIAAFVLVAIAFFFVLLSGTPLTIGSFSLGAKKATVYTVVGDVQTSDNDQQTPIPVIVGWPVASAFGGQQLSGIRVWRGPDGKFPVIVFQSNKYAVTTVDLSLPVFPVDDVKATITIPIQKLQAIPGGSR